MIHICRVILMLGICSFAASGQNLVLQKQEFELRNVTGAIVDLKGEKVLKIERDLTAIPFDARNLGSTVDEPTYARLVDTNFENGIIEVKVLSRIQNPSPFEAAQGFIGLAFRINENDTAFESVYLRPKAGRSDNQFARNHTVQYFAYPDYKFDRLRKEAVGVYETYADVGLDEWISLKIEVDGPKAKLYVNGQKHPSFIVNQMKGKTTTGSIGLWVDIGTTGYFKDLKITKY